jgi:peroxiredoxin
MSRQNKRRCGVTTIISGIVLIAVVTCIGCKKRPEEPTQTKHYPEQAKSEPVAKNISESAKTDTNVPAIATIPKVRLYDVIKAARTWQPVYTSLYRKPAPDFVLTDITGKVHKLSDYRGKDVLLIFWATWCPPCRMEVPDLIELRRTVSEDKLAMLAISNEKPDLVKKFVADQMINYTIFLDKGNMPAPFGFMRIYRTTGVPCSFFINAEGKIKLAASGLLSLDEIKAILQAE